MHLNNKESLKARMIGYFCLYRYFLPPGAPLFLSKCQICLKMEACLRISTVSLEHMLAILDKIRN